MIIAIFTFLFRFFRELEDEIARGNMSNWAFFPNSREGWTAKWKYPFKPYITKWYHFGIKPKYEERFAYSSTILVFTTDAEHFYQFIQTVSIITMLCLATSLPIIHVLVAVVSGFATAQIIKEIIKKID